MKGRPALLDDISRSGAAALKNQCGWLREID